VSKSSIRFIHADFSRQGRDASIAYYLDALASNCYGEREMHLACIAGDSCSIFLADDNQSQPRMWVWIGVQDRRAGCPRTAPALSDVRRKDPQPSQQFRMALEMQVEDLDGNVQRLGSDPEKEKPLGVWRDADGIRSRHLGNERRERASTED
jgi:hypothetical protein